MGLMDKAKEAANKASDKASEKMSAFDSDSIIAEAITKAVEKQEKVNDILLNNESNYRIDGIELSMGIPPTVTFSVGRVGDSKNTKMLENNE
jgi:hypothetical protein